MSKLAVVVLIMAFSKLVFAADLTVVYQVKSGKAAASEITEYWSDQYHLSVDRLSKVDVLTDSNKGIIYTIDHEKKQIDVLNIKEAGENMKRFSQITSNLGNQPSSDQGKTQKQFLEEQMKKNFGVPNGLQKLGTLTVVGRSCDIYKVERKGESFEQSSEICIDQSLIPTQNSNPDLAKLSSFYQKAGTGIYGDADAMSVKNELAAIKGLTLKRVDTIKAAGEQEVSSQEASMVKIGQINPKLFRLPIGYQQIDQGKLQRENLDQMQKDMGPMAK